MKKTCRSNTANCANTNTFVNGTGRGFDYAGGTIESGALIAVPSRDLLVCMFRNGSGQLVVQYAQVGAANTQPVMANASLSASAASTASLSFSSAASTAVGNRRNCTP